MGGNLATALYAASAGAAVLGMLSMARRWTQAFAYRAGLALFGLIAVLQAGNFIEASSVRLPVWSIQLIGALAATTLPVAWLYTRDLISDHPRPLMRADILHFIVPIAFAPHIVWAALGLGQAEEDALWGLTPMTDDARWFAGVGIVLTIAWVLQVSIYSVRIAYALLALPKRLRLVFADTKGRDLLWMRVIGLLIIAHLPFAILANLGLIDPPETTFAVFAFALTLGLAGATGVQTPVFQESPSEPKRTVAISAADIATEKYARSLLDEARLERIATRLESAFEQDKLHLDANLSLGKLSERLGVSENHLSQTFTRKIGLSFFEYVNARRVETAKALLKVGTSSIVDIGVEVGFNSKSAFYNAFRTVTGMTPAAFRDAQASSALEVQS